MFDQLKRERPTGLHYASFKLDEGVSFVHPVSRDADDAGSLTEGTVFKAFTAEIRDRCETQPVTTDVKENRLVSIFRRVYICLFEPALVLA